ncbi:MAG: 1-deoxy-D-xylulose-5-phosphate reductoisomerase [Thermaerobacter sp.]|nr:1-deoxy-D-xylulose-5-phosphate reductoisomerase [Thermaerobacter sp.]
MRRLLVLGSTGSVGRQTLEVVRSFPGRFRVVGLGARRNWRAAAEQAREFGAVLALEDPEAARRAARELGGRLRVLGGPDALTELASTVPADLAVGAVSGLAGLLPNLAALEHGMDLALANKETLVAAGELVTATARRGGRRILPVDSEHAAIHQCLAGEEAAAVERLLLTASGGPFRDVPAEELAAVTPQAALRHPNWAMGPKITVDSATLMNKGLEVIEATWLFGVGVEQVQVVIHPQSIVHSLVQFVDGVTMAQLGWPDMRAPIQYALCHPERLPGPVPPLDLLRAGPLTFEAPREDAFPCLRLAYAAARMGGTLPCVLNAANEVAVELFLAEKLSFTGIPRLVEVAMAAHRVRGHPSLEEVLAADAEGRRAARRAAAAC